MEVLGYSERGLLNALFFTLGQRHDGAELLRKLLKLAVWPSVSSPPEIPTCERILVEQSFSDFGDADSVFLCGSQRDGKVVFVEAKRGNYRLRDEWATFVDGCRDGMKYKGMTSTLFCQLYFKQRLADAYRDAGEQWKQVLSDGVRFPPPLNKVRRGTRRKIGSNAVVLDAVKQIGQRLADALFLAIVPETGDVVNRFWPSLGELANIDGWNDWNTNRWGYLTIPDIAKFCKERELNSVNATIAFNGSQLF